MATAAKQKNIDTQQFAIMGYDEIPVEDIEFHPKNPRPKFHLGATNADLQSLATSMRVNGQHRPAVVYELRDHYDPEVEDQPGKYRLYQGERRLRAARIGGLKTLRCSIVSTPKNFAEELEWLGNEESHKQEWSDYFHLRYCSYLAEELGVDVYSTEISSKTGVKMADLEIAKNIFQLKPEIQYFIAEHEQMKYDEMITGKRRSRSRVASTGVRSQEFSVAKASMVWEIFDSLRKNMPATVRKYSDSELQRLIAVKATQNTTVTDLKKLLGSIKQVGKNTTASTKLLAEIQELLEDDSRRVRDTIKAAGREEIQLLNEFMQRSPRLIKLATNVVENIDQVGSDPDDLNEVHTELLSLLNNLNTMERALSQQIMAGLRAKV